MDECDPLSLFPYEYMDFISTKGLSLISQTVLEKIARQESLFLSPFLLKIVPLGDKEDENVLKISNE